jgi:hypothetical protein
VAPCWPNICSTLLSAAPRTTQRTPLYARMARNGGVRPDKPTFPFVLSGARRQGRMRVRRFCQERAHRHARELRGRRDVVPGDLRVCKDRGPRVLERHDHSVCQVGERWPLPETIIFASDWDPRQLTADAGAHMQSAFQVPFQLHCRT